MIQKITISNFYSIREPLEVSFEASKDKQYGEDWIVEIGNVKLLKALLLYGANGSGKTNVLSALDFLRHLVLSTRDVDSSFGHMPFALDEQSRNNETFFDLLFFIGDVKYKYCISLTTEKIITEELRKFTGPNKSVVVYSRKFNEEKDRSIVRFGLWLDLSQSDRKDIEKATTKNISVLAAYSSRNISSAELNTVRNYFRYNFFRLFNVDGTDNEVARAVKNDSMLKSLLIDMLRSFHSNIVDIEVEEETKAIPEEARQMLMQMRTSEEEKEEISKMTTLTKHTSQYIHQTSSGKYALPDKLQSEGTRGFIRHLVLFYKAIQGNWLVGLDEFGSGLQAKTQNLLLDFFLKFSRQSQLLVATQSLGFLDYPEMRRDAINIVSKDDEGQSHLDNKTVRGIHKNINLRKAYIDGRFTTIDPNEPDIRLGDDRAKYKSLIFGDTRKEVADELS